MEVHHHSHAHGKKTWKSYFWEFLMLFLAVFCGFLAENQREHFVEHQREKKYMYSLRDDLVEDTADLRGDTAFWALMLNRMDTLRTELDKPEKERNLPLLYNQAALMRNYNNFAYHDRTIQQLKSAGNFRLIRKKSVADSLVNYDASVVTALRDQEEQSNRIYQELNFLQDRFIHTRYFSLRSGNGHARLDSAFRADPRAFSLAGASPGDLLQYYNHLDFYTRMTRYRLSTMRNLLRKANHLIGLLETEYHVK